MIVGYWVLVILLIVADLWACITLAKNPPQQRQAARPGMDLHGRALPQLRAMAADRPRMAARLAEIDRGRTEPTHLYHDGDGNELYRGWAVPVEARQQRKERGR